MKQWSVGLSLLVLTMVCHGDYRVLLEDQDRYILSQRMVYLEDPSNALAIQQIMTLQRPEWTLNSGAKSSFGYSQSTYWVHIPFSVEHSALWYVWLRYAPLDYVTFYWVKNGAVISTYQSGDALPFSVRQVHVPENASFRYLSKGEKIDLYIKIKTQGSYRIPLEMHQSQHFEASIGEVLTFQGIYYGVLIVMSVFNFVLYFITGIRSYLHYVFYVATSLFSRLTIDGTGFQFLWGSTPFINQWGVPITFWLSSMAFWLFSYTFLNINKGSLGVRIGFWFLAGLGILIGIGLPLLSYQQFVPIVILYATLLMFTSLIASIVLTLSGYRYAGVFAIATMMTAVSFGITVAESLGVYSDQTFMLYSYPLARMFEIVLFAIALGVRIRFLQERRMLAEKEAIVHREHSIKSIEQYKRLYDSAMTGNFVLDEAGSIKSANHAFYAILGSESKSIVPIYFQNEIANLFDERFHAGGLKVSKEIKGDGKWLSVNVSKVEIDGEVLYEGALIDITDRVESQKIKEQAEKSKMQALQQLVVGVAHEINTPLGVVRTSSDFAREMLSKVLVSAEKNTITKNDLVENLTASDEALKISDESVIRIVELIQSFKKVSVEQMQFDLDVLNLESLLGRLEAAAQLNQVPININIKGSFNKRITTFPEGIYWSLNELLENTCDFCNSDKGIFIEMTANKDDIEIHFYDKGVGVNDDILPVIFDPFYTSGRGANKRLGLGLYQVKNIIVQLLHGSIKAFNQDGLHFKIRIPIMHQD